MLLPVSVTLANEKSAELVRQGNELREKREYGQALELYYKAVEADKTDAIAWNNVGHILLILAKYKISLSYFEKAILLDADLCASYSNLGNAYYNLKNPAKALEILKKGKEYCPTHKNLQAGIAILKKELNLK